MRGRFRMGWALASLFGLASLAACGGSSAPINAPSESSSAREAHSHASNHDEAPADDAPVEEEAPKAGTCDDGTCSACGSGLCPAGWYCDESAAGGPACGWLPACATTRAATCGCITAKLGSGCSCSEQSGGLHVTCK